MGRLGDKSDYESIREARISENKVCAGIDRSPKS
jgi:hypothetical protein